MIVAEQLGLDRQRAVHVAKCVVVLPERQMTLATERERAGQAWLSYVLGGGWQIRRTRSWRIKQRLRTKLFVSDGATPPKIAHYTGQGDLLTWVRVVAVREAVDSIRAERRRALDSDEALMAIEASATGPEMLAFKQHYKAEFAAAFKDALTALAPQQRNVLRLHYVHGLSIDKLGAVLRVHRSNAARRIAKARNDLLSGTRRLLHARLSIDRREFDQLMGLIASRIDLSIERFLAEKAA